MAVIARQFGLPQGPLGQLVGFGMARSNGKFSRWVVDQVKQQYHGGADRIAELGPGPGVGVRAVLQQFPQAKVWAVDLSPVMLSQTRRRNLPDIKTGRLTLLRGSAAALSAVAPLDIVLANHVLYFWHEPAAEIARIKRCLRPGGLVALGYQLRQAMPAVAQERFPQLGHLLYDSDDQVGDLLRDEGFTDVTHRVMGPPEAAHGRLVMALA